MHVMLSGLAGGPTREVELIVSPGMKNRLPFPRSITRVHSSQWVMGGWMVVSITIIIEGWVSVHLFLDSQLKVSWVTWSLSVDYSLRFQRGWAASIHSQCAREQNSATY